MDSTTKQILFKIDVQDNSKGTWERLEKTLDNVEGKTNKVGTEMDKTTGKTVVGGEKMATSIAKGTIAGNLLIEGFKMLGNVAKQAFDLAVQGAKAFVDLAIQGDAIGDVAGRFQKNFKKSEDALTKFRKATGGTITDFQLMKSASQVASFGLTKDASKIAEIWRFSRSKAEELGLTTEEVFNQITNAVGRGRDAQLKELGLTTEGYDKLIKKMGDSADKLTDRQKAQLLLNDVLVQSKKVQDAEIDGYEVLQTSIANARNELAQEFTPVLNDLATAVLPLVKEGIAGVKKFIEDAKDPSTKLGEAFTDMKTALTGDKGLIKSVENLLGQLSEPETIKMIGKLVDNMTKFIDGVTWLVDHAKEIANVVGILNRLAAALATFGLSEAAIAFGKLKKYNDLINDAETSKKSHFDTGNISKGSQSQAGGFVQRTGMVTVGEAGREKVLLPQGSKVIPNGVDTASSTINVNINGTVYGVDQLKQMVVGAVTEAQRNQNYLGRYNLL